MLDKCVLLQTPRAEASSLSLLREAFKLAAAAEVVRLLNFLLATAQRSGRVPSK